MIEKAIEPATWITLSEAARQLPTLDGRRIHPSSLWRWCRKGLRGEHLRYRKLGARIVVTMADITEFSERLAAADPACVAHPPRAEARPPRARTDRQRAVDISRAERELERAGVTGPRGRRGASR